MKRRGTQLAAIELLLLAGALTACGGGSDTRGAAIADAGSPGVGSHDGGAAQESGIAVQDGGAHDASTDAGAHPSPEGGAAEASVDAGSGPDDAHADAPSSSDPPGVFVAVGYGGRRLRSTDDGRTWTDDQSLEASGGDDQDLLRTVAFADGVFLAAGWQALSSPDGKMWTALPPTKQNWFGALAHAESTWVGVGGYGMRVTSTDGTTWTDHAVDTTAAHPHGCLTVAGGAGGASPVFVACNDGGARSWSADGATWSYATGASGVTSSQVVAGAGVVVGVDGAQVVLSHDDGHSWAAAATLDSPGGGLVFAQGHFTYLGTGAVYTSTDGASWQKHAAPGVSPAALAFGHGTYVAVQAHAWQRLVDGVAWEAVVADPSKDNALEWVTFGAVASP